MGKVSFPLHNVRKDIINKWHLAQLTEEVIVPSQADPESGFYTVSLTEIPDSSSNNPVTISGLTEYRGNPYDEKTKKVVIAANQFYVNYATGEILFNSAQSGAQHTVNYWGKGSLVEADDVNDLNDRVVSNTSTISTLQEAVSQSQQAVSGIVADVNDVKSQTATVVASVAEINTDLESVHSDLNLKANKTDVDSAIADVTSLVQSYAEDGGVIDTKIESKMGDYVTEAAYESDQATKSEQYDAKYATISSVETVSQDVSGVSSRVETLENAGYITSEALEPLATKEEIADMAVKSDLEGLASEQFVSEAIAPLATKSELEPLASKEYVGEQISEIDIPDVSEFVTAEYVASAISGSGHVSPSQLSGLVAVDGVNASSAQHKITTKRNNKDLTAMIWNEESGGGAMFTNNDANIKSFIGVNNGVDVTPNFWVQGYAIDIASKLGSRIELSTDGFYYTKNQTNYSYTADDEVVVKKDLPDVSSFIIPNQLSGLVAVNGTNASSAQHKIKTTRNNKELVSMIWNEASGGGAMFTANDADKKSFIGVNDGAADGDEIWVQGYAKKISNNTGTRITLTTEGFYYTKNQANGSYVAANEVVTKNELDPVDAKVDSTHDAFLERIVNLEMKIADLSRSNIDNVPSTAQITYSDPAADVVISADAQVTQPSTITAGSIEVSSLNVDSTRVSFTSEGKVKIGGFESTGTYPKSQGNAQVIITTDDYVEIRNSTFGTNGYNAIEIGLNNAVPKSVVIDNCQFGGNLTNNAILVFGHQDDAIVKVSNCTFTKVSNALRISNRTNTKGTFIFENCTFTEWDSRLKYSGAIICEDYSSKSVAAETENNLFAPDKIKIKFINCTGPDGNVIVGGSDPSVYCGSNDENQIMYVYNDYGGALAYDPARYPEVTFV